MADDLETYLNNLPDKIREHLDDVLREQAFRLSDAQRAALQGLEQDPETGALEASCTVTQTGELEYTVSAGGNTTTKEVRDGSGAPYDTALAFEFGNSRQPPRPWFWPTYRQLKPEIHEAIQDAVNEAINE